MTDEENDGKKSNAKIEFRRKDVARQDHAPTGATGLSFGPGGGVRPVRSFSSRLSHARSAETELEIEVDLEDENTKHDKPFAMDTDDDEVNRDTDAKGYERITEKDIERLNAAKASISPEPEKSGVFKETDDPEVNAFYAKEHEGMISKEEQLREQAEGIAKARQLSRNKDKGLER